MGLFWSWKQLFAVGSTTEVKYKSFEQESFVLSAYTSAIERSLLKWNGHDCDVAMHVAVGFYCCHVAMFWYGHLVWTRSHGETCA